ncbi:MAG: hypothetical protein IPL01_23830 [Acidobacteria bacterium]|nr:hypothetical protein [Acidobacteriota bacterium]
MRFERDQQRNDESNSDYGPQIIGTSRQYCCSFVVEQQGNSASVTPF